MTRERWERLKASLGTIYALITDDGCWVKIGFSTRWSRRKAILARSDYHRFPRHLAGSVFYLRSTKSAPRELYPVAVLNHPACRALFGPPPSSSAAA